MTDIAPSPRDGLTKEQRKIAVAMGRRFGASPAARERMAAADDAATWRAVCRHCGERLLGSRKQLMAHICITGPKAVADGK